MTWSRVLSLRGHSNYTIISLPQSLHFGDAQNQQLSVQEVQERIQSAGLLLQQQLQERQQHQQQQPSTSIIMSKQRVYLLWREQESYELAQRLYPMVSHATVPDMAFQLGPFFRRQQQHQHQHQQHEQMMMPRALHVDILLLLRRDHESTIVGETGSHQFVCSLLEPLQKDTSFSIVDWPGRVERFDSDGKYFDEAAIQLLGMGKVVIVDRLHAVILAYQMGLPIVYIDPISGKISKTLHVALEGCSRSNIVKADTMSQAIHKAVDMLNKLPAIT